MRFAVALALLLGFSAVAEAGCWGWGCYRWRPCCRPVYVQPVPVQVPVATGVVVRRGLFGRLVIQPNVAVCGPQGCQPVAPTPDVGPSVIEPQVKVDAPGVNVEVR